jgi:hypothetical protein
MATRLSRLNTRPSEGVLRQFAAACLFAGALGLVKLLSQGPTIPRYTLIILGFVIGAAGLIQPEFVRVVYIGASLIAFPLGWVVSHVLLGLLYWGLITPLAWIMRMRHRDRLRIKRPFDSGTYWVTRPSSDEPSRYLQQF